MNTIILIREVILEDLLVIKFMVPLADYATVREEATMGDAILALEKAEKDFRSSHLHRAILVLGKDNKVVGKLSEFDVIRSLEPKYKELGETRKISRAGINVDSLKSMQTQLDLWAVPFQQACSNAAKHPVKDFMYTPTEGEFVNENATLREALHQIIIGHHHSLLVTSGDDIVGVLRASDGFKSICEEIKTVMSEK